MTRDIRTALTLAAQMFVQTNAEQTEATETSSFAAQHLRKWWTGFCQGDQGRWHNWRHPEYQTLYFTISRHWKVTFTVQSLYFTTSAPQSPSLPPIYKHSVSTFSRISAQMRRNFSINLLKTMSVRLQMRAVRFSLHDYRCRTFHHNIIITISAEKWFFSFVYLVSFFGKSVTLKIRVDGGDRLWNRNCAESAQKEQ